MCERYLHQHNYFFMLSFLVLLFLESHLSEAGGVLFVMPELVLHNLCSQSSGNWLRCSASAVPVQVGCIHGELFLFQGFLDRPKRLRYVDLKCASIPPAFQDATRLFEHYTCVLVGS